MTNPYLPSAYKRLIFLTLLSFVLIFPFVTAKAQFSASASGISYELGRNAAFSGLDTIAVFENTNTLSNPVISFTYDGVDSYTYTWYKVDENGNETEVSQEQNTLSTALLISDPDIGEGTYRLNISNILINANKYCAIIDYANYPITINELVIHDDGEVNGNIFDPCISAYLEADYQQNDIIMYDPVTGLNIFTPRKNFAWTWSEAATTPDYSGRANPVPVSAVFKNSTYNCDINDDFFTTDDNMMEGVQASLDYDAIAVTLTGIAYTVIERPGDNEYIKFEENAAGQLTGSAPLDVNFEAEEPSDAVENYQWKIWHGTDTARAYITNTETTRYSFTTPIPSEEESNAADYTVKLMVSNAVCDSSATQEIKLRTSRLEAPNLFVIGFGAQLDYRADYSSILPETFHGYIYNRWGRKVYEWSDITKGWDGRLHGTGKFVSPGAYVVVLRGEGTDGEEYKIRHSLTILREK